MYFSALDFPTLPPMQIFSPSFGRRVFSTWKTCSQKSGEDKSDTIRHSLTSESSMQHGGAKKLNFLSPCWDPAELSWMSFSRSTRPLWPAPDANCASSSSSLRRSRKLKPHAVSEKSPIMSLLQIATKLQRQGLKKRSNKKAPWFWRKKTQKKIPHLLTSKTWGWIEIHGKKTEVSLLFFQMLDAGRPASPWMPTSTGFVRPIRSPLMSTSANSCQRWKQTTPGRRNDILIDSGSGILIVASYNAYVTG